MRRYARSDLKAPRDGGAELNERYEERPRPGKGKNHNAVYRADPLSAGHLSRSERGHARSFQIGITMPNSLAIALWFVGAVWAIAILALLFDADRVIVWPVLLFGLLVGATEWLLRRMKRP
jgi:hypothetical protein